MRILISGASGLLGSDLVHEAELRSLRILKLCRHKRSGYISLDFSDISNLEKLKEMDWDYVIHSAALREPDKCAEKHKYAEKLNIDSTRKIAEFAEERNAGILYISTDYVFDGKTPPYNEDSDTGPVNFYGKTKLEGEKCVRDITDNHIILRIPVLYGYRAGIEKAALIASSLKILKNPEKKFYLDKRIIKYPTYTGDVAEAAFFLIEKGLKGTFHFSSDDRHTKLSMHRTICSILGKSLQNVSGIDSNNSQTNEQRPLDSHLNTFKIQRLGFRKNLSFGERMSAILKDLRI